MHDVTVIAHCDNQPAPVIIDSGYTGNTEHIQIRWNCIYELCLKYGIHMKYVPSNEQLADLLTKPLSRSSIGNGGVLRVCGSL